MACVFYSQESNFKCMLLETFNYIRNKLYPFAPMINYPCCQSSVSNLFSKFPGTNPNISANNKSHLFHPRLFFYDQIPAKWQESNFLSVLWQIHKGITQVNSFTSLLPLSINVKRVKSTLSQFGPKALGSSMNLKHSLKKETALLL